MSSNEEDNGAMKRHHKDARLTSSNAVIGPGHVVQALSKHIINSISEVLAAGDRTEGWHNELQAHLMGLWDNDLHEGSRRKWKERIRELRNKKMQKRDSWSDLKLMRLFDYLNRRFFVLKDLVK